MNLFEFLQNNPPTLAEAVERFSDPLGSVQFVVSWRWPDGKVSCPACGSEAVTWLPTRFLYQCKARHPKRQFSVKVGTVFEDSAIPLRSWLILSWMFANGGMKSTYDTARNLEITQKSAWFMMKRLREHAESLSAFDETHDSEEIYEPCNCDTHLSL